MHQSHNIPWHILCKHIKVFEVSEDSLASSSMTTTAIRCGYDGTPLRKLVLLYRRDLPEECKELRHFATAFARTIKEFSQAERRKYPSAEKLKQEIADGEETIFPEDFITRFEAKYGALDDDPQGRRRLERYRLLGHEDKDLRTMQLPYWKANVHNGGPLHRHMHFAGYIKVLLEFGELHTPLRLAHVPEIPLATLRSYGQSHQMGFLAAAELALTIYIWLNVVAAYPNQKLIEDETYVNTLFHLKIWNWHIGHRDYNAQCVPHQRIWGWPQDTGVAIFSKGANEVHDYLAYCFRILYMYDVLATEIGVEEDWRQRIEFTLDSCFRFKLYNHFYKPQYQLKPGSLRT